MITNLKYKYMIIPNAKILRIGEPKSGTSVATGKPYYFQPIDIHWEEEKLNYHGEKYTIEHETQVTLTGDMAKNFTLNVDDNIIIDLRFNLREYQGRYYTDIFSGYVRLQTA